MKASSCNRDDSSNSTGATGSKLDHSRDKDEKHMVKENIQMDRHMNSFLDDCITEDKSFVKSHSKSKKRSKNKNRPSTSLFNKKRKSSGQALLTGFKGNKNLRPESAMGVNKSANKKGQYRPSSAFATHYTKTRPKSKKHVRHSHTKANKTNTNQSSGNLKFKL